MIDAVAAAYVFLLRATAPPAPAVDAFVSAYGAVEAVERIRAETAPPYVMQEIARPDIDIAADLRLIEDGQARVLTPLSPDWPTDRLAGLRRADLGRPLALWVRGTASLRELTQTAVAVTGTRASSEYGDHVAAMLGADLARATVTVVGGGSYGIEVSAHRAALVARGPNLVVLATGIDVPYPRDTVGLLEAIVQDGGLVITEHPPRRAPQRHHFHQRLRLLAALSGATVIVEAGLRSGARAIATLAGQLGRRVYGVPGPITSATSRGVHELLSTGAAIALSDTGGIDYTIPATRDVSRP